MLSSKHRFALASSVLAVVALLSVGGCGFQPIASTQNDNETLRVRGIKIDDAPRRFAYDLDQALNRLLIEDPNADYELLIEVGIKSEGLAIEQDDAVTRINLTATAHYSLKKSDGVAGATGRVISVTALNATSSQYATEVNRRDALERLANDLANRITSAMRIRGLSAQAQ